MNKENSIYAILFLIPFFYSCNSNPLDVKLDESEVSIEYINADQALNNKSLEEQLGDLFIYELSQNIQQNVNDSSYRIIHEFYNSEYISDLEAEKEKLYSELPKHEQEINSAFKYLRHHFGDTIVPKQIFY